MRDLGAVLVAALRAVLDVARGNHLNVLQRVLHGAAEHGIGANDQEAHGHTPHPTEEPGTGATAQGLDQGGTQELTDQPADVAHEAPDADGHDRSPLAQPAPGRACDDRGVLDDGCPQAAANADERVLVHGLLQVEVWNERLSI